MGNIKNSALYNTDINEIANKLKIKNYIGCFADNNFPDLDNGDCVIVNYQSDYEGGTHWTALRRVGKQLIHFDSLGFAVDEPIVEYAKKQGLIILTKPIHIQDDKSFYCGHYCLEFLKMFNKSKDIFKFYEQYDTTETAKAFKANDVKIRSNLLNW